MFSSTAKAALSPSTSLQSTASTFSSLHHSATSSNSTSTSTANLDPTSPGYAEAAFAMLTGALKKFRADVWMSLQCEPNGYSCLDKFIEDFINDVGYCPEQRCREFGYPSLCSFLYSDYMRHHCQTHFSHADGQIYFRGIPTESTSEVISAIAASNWNKQFVAFKKKRRIEMAARRAQYQQNQSQEQQQGPMSAAGPWRQRSYP